MSPVSRFSVDSPPSGDFPVIPEHFDSSVIIGANVSNMDGIEKVSMVPDVHD